MPRPPHKWDHFHSLIGMAEHIQQVKDALLLAIALKVGDAVLKVASTSRGFEEDRLGLGEYRRRRRKLGRVELAEGHLVGTQLWQRRRGHSEVRGRRVLLLPIALEGPA